MTIVARYAFWDADQDDDAAFDRRLGAVLREVGERGKLVLSEAVPPSFREPTPAPAPAPAHAALAPAPAPLPVSTRRVAEALATAVAPVPAAPALAPAPAPARVPTPALAPLAPTPAAPSPDPSLSVQQSPATSTSQIQMQAASGASSLGSDMSVFMAEQLKGQVEENKQLREEAYEAKLHAAKAETERVRQELTPREAISAGQLTALQSRFEALHVAELLSDEEYFTLEDLCADFIELQSKTGVVTRETMLTSEVAAKVCTLVALSEKMAADAGFARQTRRKFTS